MGYLKKHFFWGEGQSFFWTLVSFLNSSKTSKPDTRIWILWLLFIISKLCGYFKICFILMNLQSSNEIKVTELACLFSSLPMRVWWIALFLLTLFFSVSLWINAEDHNKFTSYLLNLCLRLKVIWIWDYQQFPERHSLSPLSGCQLNWNICIIWIHANLVQKQMPTFWYMALWKESVHIVEIFFMLSLLYTFLSRHQINFLILSVNIKTVASINNK